MSSHLEDDFCDIIKKARSGLGLSIEAAAKASGLSQTSIRSLETGERNPDGNETKSLAKALRLDGAKLLQIATGVWQPKPPPEQTSPSVISLNGDYHGYEVHGYLCFDPGTREAVLIDTAFEPAVPLAAIDKHRLTLRMILLTHGHGDHMGGLDELRAATGARVGVSGDEMVLYEKHTRQSPDLLIGRGGTIPVGPLQFNVLSTPGHTPGGITYQCGPAAFTGDALFAGSTGRSMSPEGYGTLLTAIRDRILTLPPGTRLFPGHGPATTVGEERSHNPFFPEG
jgi:hydroxyacylglutathione hydrolase